MLASTVRSPVMSRSPTNSSRKSRRRLLSEREYRANSAPLTTSGRLTSAKTGPSRFVKYGRRTACSSSSKGSATYCMGRRGYRCPSPAPGMSDASDEQAEGPRTDPHRQRRGGPGGVAVEADGERPFGPDQDLAAGGGDDPRVRQVVADGQPAPHGAPLPRPQRVDLDLEAAV